MIQQQVNIQKITLTPSERNYLQHKRCFTACVNKQFKQATLKDDEKLCIRNCLLKYKDAEKFLAEKVHRYMQTLIRSDMSLMASYREEEDAKGNKA